MRRANSIIGAAAATLLSLAPFMASADGVQPFESGWTLDGDASDLNFMSVKKGTKMELSKFAKLQGVIDETGETRFEVLLDSVDTQVDLRNVRLRFLMFETFAYPKAVISTQLTKDMLGDLEVKGVQRISLPFVIDLHGVQKAMTADVIASLSGPDQVTVASVAPLILELADFGLMGGRDKLQETAEVTITPATAITFALTFQRNQETQIDDPFVLAAADNVALEPRGNLSIEACEGRFEILSRTGNINFDQGSSRLKASSNKLLTSVADILNKCPGMIVEVSGHTDSIGKKSQNFRLSENRAASVVARLVEMGVKRSNMVAKGYADTRPVADNATAPGRQRNRRIEFSIVGYLRADR